MHSVHRCELLLQLSIHVAYVMCECWPCTAVNPASRDQNDSGESEMRAMDDDVG